jgi:hypothetical protein
MIPRAPQDRGGIAGDSSWAEDQNGADHPAADQVARSIYSGKVKCIYMQRKQLIGKIEGKLQQSDSHTHLFTPRWALK